MTQSRVGAIAVPDLAPRLSATSGEIGEAIGAQNEEIFRDLLGFEEHEVSEMRDQGVICIAACWMILAGAVGICPLCDLTPFKNIDWVGRPKIKTKECINRYQGCRGNHHSDN